jgi:allophanate hydrolase subunit 2
MPPAGLKLLKTGPLDLIIDCGRHGLRDRGVGPGGPADRWAFTLTNALAGNGPEAKAAALEFSLVGPTLLAGQTTGCALSGSVRSAQLHHANGTTVQLAPWSSFTLQSGDRLCIGPVTGDLRGYLAIRGGIQSPRIAGSRQSLIPLQAESLLPAGPGQLPSRHMDADWARSPRPGGPLRVLPGPQWDQLGWPDGQNPEATVADRVDRMGVRLNLTRPAPAPSAGLPSEPVCPGVIQAPSTTEWIILGVGCQTLGGYAKVAQVIEADLDRVGRLRPGDTLALERVRPADAVAANREYRRRLARCCQAALLTLSGR